MYWIKDILIYCEFDWHFKDKDEKFAWIRNRYEAPHRVVRVPPFSSTPNCSSHVTTYFQTMLYRGSNIQRKIQ